MLAYFAAEVGAPAADRGHPAAPRRAAPLLVDLAPRLPPDLQEVLLLRQDAILDEPAILDALEANPQLSAYTQRRIAEYREHLLPRAAPGAAAVPRRSRRRSTTGPGGRPGRGPASCPPSGEVEEQTGLSEGQIRMLPVPARVQLSRGATRSLRSSCCCATRNPRVAVAVLSNNQLSEQELEQIAAQPRPWSRRCWTRSRGTASGCASTRSLSALVQNPRTPLADRPALVPRLAVRDLRDLCRDRNVPDAVRSTALRLYRIKQTVGSQTWPGTSTPSSRCRATRPRSRSASASGSWRASAIPTASRARRRRAAEQ